MVAQECYGVGGWGARGVHTEPNEPAPQQTLYSAELQRPAPLSPIPTFAMLLPIVASLQLATATPTPAEGIFNGREHHTVVALPRVETDVTVDGRLDEPVWQQAAMLTGFSLYQPVDGRPAPDSTEVLVWYSSSAMYFGIRAYESHAAVTVSLAERDRISSDDNVEIHLDTFDELNRALVFAVNPLGVQADGTKSEGGGFIPGSNVGPGQNDLSADFVWQSRGHVTDWGYEVEVRIPFSSMRYPTSTPQKWGIQIDRHVQHSGYEETWTPAIHASASFIVQEGFLTGLTGMHHGTSVELNPEVTNTVTGTPCCSPLQQSWRYTSNPQLGGNVRWALGSNFVLNGTVKPDFSQVEADATQIAADERFALFYPEKRPFFVEALDQFNVPNSLVYTRTIVQPARRRETHRQGGARRRRRALGGRSGRRRASTDSDRSSTSSGCARASGSSRRPGSCTAIASRPAGQTGRSAATRRSYSAVNTSLSSSSWRA